MNDDAALDRYMDELLEELKKDMPVNKYTRPAGRGHVEIRKQGDWWYMQCHAPHGMPIVHQSASWQMSMRLAEHHVRWHEIMSLPHREYYK